MNLKRLLNIIYKIKPVEIFWFIFGFLVFIPLEIFHNGLWFSYIQILILFLNSRAFKFLNLSIFLAWCTIVVISTLISDFASLQSAINPLLAVLILMAGRLCTRTIKIILYGIYTSALMCIFQMIHLLLEQNINSLFVLLSSREWGRENIIGFGNGLAILFSISMLFAYKQSKYLLMIVLFVGGVLTTSRIPFFSLVIIIVTVFINSKNFSTKILTFFIVIISLFAFLISEIMPTQQELELLAGRISETEDRFDVYNLAWIKFLENPFFGIGSTKLLDYEHAHNSYLQVLSKYGFFGFILWLLLWYYSFFKGINFVKNLDFIFIFISISVFQIGLLNPNALILMVLYRWMFIFPITSTVNKRLDHV